MIVEERIIVEIKAVDRLSSLHKAQLLTYLKLTDFGIGLLVNFDVSLLKDGLRRLTHQKELVCAPRLPDVMRGVRTSDR